MAMTAKILCLSTDNSPVPERQEQRMFVNDSFILERVFSLKEVLDLHTPLAERDSCEFFVLHVASDIDW